MKQQPYPNDDIIITLDIMLARRKMTLSELALAIGVQLPNLSMFKNGHGRVVKLETLMRMCNVLKCTPNDIIQFRPKGTPEPDLREGRRGWL